MSYNGVMRVIELMNYNAENPTGNSLLTEVVEGLIPVAAQLSKPIDDFIVTNPNVMENPERHKDLSRLNITISRINEEKKKQPEDGGNTRVH